MQNLQIDDSADFETIISNFQKISDIIFKYSAVLKYFNKSRELTRKVCSCKKHEDLIVILLDFYCFNK